MCMKLYTVCGAIALVLIACSEDNGSVGGTSVEPNTVYAGRALWNPQAGDYHVNTARYAKSWPDRAVEDGRWFWEMQNDSLDGGGSYIEWPVDFSEDGDSLTAVVDACGGICGTAVLEKGVLAYDPFISVGFTVAKSDSDEEMPVDVSNWGGLCISYSSEVEARLLLDLSNEVDVLLSFGVPFFELPATDTVVSKCVRWSEFELPSWVDTNVEYWKTDAGIKAAKELVAVRLQIQAKEGRYKFNVKYIGTVDDMK